MAEEKRGIEETKDVLDFMFSFIDAVGKQKRTEKCLGVMRDIL